MTENDTGNPYQSPVVLPSPQTRPFPNRVLCGIAVALVVVCIGLLFVEPGLGILASLLVCPGLLRWFVSIRRSTPQRGVNLQSVSAMAISILMMIPIGVAGYVGFGVFCFAAYSILTTTSQYISPPDPHGDPYGFRALEWAVPIGIISGVLIFGVIFWLTLPRRKAAKEVADQESGGGQEESE